MGCNARIIGTDRHRGVFKQFQNYVLGNGLKRLCGVFAGCVVNYGGNDPEQTEVHRDVKEAQYGYSCIFSYGKYMGGSLVLQYMISKKVVEIAPGDMFLFPDCLIHHCNEPAEGNRSSEVAFTQENMFDLWHWEYNMKLYRQDRKQRKGKRSDLLFQVSIVLVPPKSKLSRKPQN